MKEAAVSRRDVPSMRGGPHLFLSFADLQAPAQHKFFHCGAPGTGPHRLKSCQVTRWGRRSGKSPREVSGVRSGHT